MLLLVSASACMCPGWRQWWEVEVLMLLCRDWMCCWMPVNSAAYVHACVCAHRKMGLWNICGVFEPCVSFPRLLFSLSVNGSARCMFIFGFFYKGIAAQPMLSCSSAAGDDTPLPRYLPETWLILPAVICLSQRLSHACSSISFNIAKLWMAH